MMTNKTKGFTAAFLVIAVLGIVLGAYHYYFEKHDYPSFKTLRNVGFEQVSLQPSLTLGFKADAIFYNPSPISVDINSIYCEVFIDGKKTTTIQQALEQKMPASAEFAIPLQFKIPLSKGKLLQDLGQLLGGAWKKKSVNIRSVGTISITIAKLSMDIPFEQEDTYKLEDYLN